MLEEKGDTKIMKTILMFCLFLIKEKIIIFSSTKGVG